MSKRSLNGFTTVLTWPSAVTGSQVHSEKLVHRVLSARLRNASLLLQKLPDPGEPK